MDKTSKVLVELYLKDYLKKNKAPKLKTLDSYDVVCPDPKYSVSAKRVVLQVRYQDAVSALPITIDFNLLDYLTFITYCAAEDAVENMG